jgi:hypothetical protein
VVISTNRERKLRLLLKKAKMLRKEQAKKIDVLCKDFVSAHREFIAGLSAVSFTADFYEAIVGISELDEVLCKAAGMLSEQIPGVNIVFFLRQGGGCQMHVFEGEQPADMDQKRIENCISGELVDAVSTSNRICTLEDMFALGMQANPKYLERLSAYAAPLVSHGCGIGFVLLYRSSHQPLKESQLQRVVQIKTGLARAIAACMASAGAAAGQTELL